MIAGWENSDYVQFNMDFQAKKYGQTYEEFLKNAREPDWYQGCRRGFGQGLQLLDRSYTFSL